MSRHIEYSKFGDKFKEKWGVTTEHHQLAIEKFMIQDDKRFMML